MSGQAAVEQKEWLPAFSSCNVLLAGLTGTNPEPPLEPPLGPDPGAAPSSPAVERPLLGAGCMSSRDLSILL